MAAASRHVLRRLNVCTSPGFTVQRHFANQTKLTAASNVANEKINRLLQAYEDIVGLAEVRDAQENVIKAEKDFLAVQSLRREKQVSLTDVQGKLRAIGMRREKANRGEQLHLDLVTQEHNMIREEQAIEEEIANVDKSEREKFNILSSAVRESHEKERARAERTKYWSLIGSIIGATIGILGTSVNNYFRMQELRRIIKESAEQSTDFRVLAAELATTTKTQFNRMEEFLGELRLSLGSTGQSSLQKATSQNPNVAQSSVILEKQTKEILDIVTRQDSAVEAEMRAIKELLATEKASEGEASVVYVGPRVEGLLRETQDNLSWRIKLGSLATVTAVYAGVALGVAVVFSIFKGS